MHSAPYRLDQLPVEVLRHIASLGNCETVLALSEVNNTLRAACNDPWVYKALIDNRNGYRAPEWPHHLPLTMQSPVSSWARYALADSKASHDNASNFTLTSIVSWAPQLFAHHHPLLGLINSLTLFNTLDLEQTRPTESTNALAFCLALRLMAKETGSVPNSPMRRILRRKLTRCLCEPLNVVPTFTIRGPAILMLKRVRALRAVGAFSTLLRETIEGGGIRYPVHVLHQTPAMAVPTSTDIPLHLMLDLPLPFTSSASVELLSCHLAKMTTVEFLEDGEWAGFYTMSSYTPRVGLSGSVLFDPPMHGIRFVATAQCGDPIVLSLQGTGKDAIAAFDLEGKLNPETGNISLSKRYSGGYLTWDWVCIMTPAGIVGSWGQQRSEGGRYGGWIWLWKTGWTAKQNL